MTLVWSPTALRHIAEIRRYIARFNPQAAAGTAAAFVTPSPASAISPGAAARAGCLTRANW